MQDLSDLPELERQRSQLYADLSQVGDFLPGSLAAVRRRCGRANCACGNPARPGHGPQYNLTQTVAGRTVAVHYKPGPVLDKVEREVANHKCFRGLAPNAQGALRSPASSRMKVVPVKCH